MLGTAGVLDPSEINDFRGRPAEVGEQDGGFCLRGRIVASDENLNGRGQPGGIRDDGRAHRVHGFHDPRLREGCLQRRANAGIGVDQLKTFRCLADGVREINDDLMLRCQHDDVELGHHRRINDNVRQPNIVDRNRIIDEPDRQYQLHNLDDADQRQNI